MKKHTYVRSIIVALGLIVLMTGLLSACIYLPKEGGTVVDSVMKPETDYLAPVATAIEVKAAHAAAQTAPSKTKTIKGRTWYLVETANELAYVLLTGGSKDYLLCEDFLITDDDWNNRYYKDPQSSAYVANVSTISGAVYDETNTRVEGENHTVTYRPNLSTSGAKGYPYGGLFSIFNGTLEDLNFVFDGRYEANASLGSSSTLYYGSLAARFGGTIQRCSISYMGTMMVYGNNPEGENGYTLNVGGLFGMMEGGRVVDSIVMVSGNVTVRNKYVEGENDTQDKVGLRNVLHAGGVTGYAKALVLNEGTVTKPASFENCDMRVSAAVMTCDSVVYGWGEDLFGGVLGFLREDPNGENCVYPAGGVAAYADGLQLVGCDLTVGATMTSIGDQLSAKHGAVAGSIVGIAASGASLTMQENVLHLGGSLKTINRRYEGYNYCGAVYKGGLVGRFEGTLSGLSSLKNNAIYFDTDIPESVGDDAKGGEFSGYLAGNGESAMSSWNKGNNWVLNRGDEDGSDLGINQTTKNDGTDSDTVCGTIYRMIVYGGGEVTVAMDANGTMVMRAEQKYSPFYGWLSSLSNATHIQDNEVVGTDGDYPVYRTSFNPGQTTVYAVFLTTEIKTAGNLVQWAEEMNGGLNYSWVKTEFAVDAEEGEPKQVLVEKGIPHVKKFKGTLLGNGHTLIFGAGVVMSGTETMGIFGELETGAEVSDLHIDFAGEMNVGDFAGRTDSTKRTEEIKMGILAAVNSGTVRNVNLLMRQAGRLTAIAANATVGGLVGLNKGLIESTTVQIEGFIEVLADAMKVGGMIGVNQFTEWLPYNMVTVSGKISGRLLSMGAGNATIGGAVGASESPLSFMGSLISVDDTSNVGGATLVSTCSHTVDNYKEALDILQSTNVAYAPDDINDAEDLLMTIGVGADSRDEYKYIMETAIPHAATLTGTALVSYMKGELAVMVSQLDASGACPDCADSAYTSLICADMGGYNYTMNTTWVVGSYRQYPNEEPNYAVGVSTHKTPCFGKVVETLSELQEADLNMIYVRDGKVVATLGEYGEATFTIAIEDTAHVFTGWYTDYDQSEMVPDSMTETGAFKPGRPMGAVYFSSVILSRITSVDQLKLLSSTTNAGQTYKDVKFTLGTDLRVAVEFCPIGSPENRFEGTFDGAGHVIYMAGTLKRAVVSDGYGLFGCLGESAQVIRLGVEYESSLNLPADSVFGGIVAYNYGNVGQGSHNQRVNVTYRQAMMSGRVMGGVVGINSATVQNVEVNYICESDSKAGWLSAVSAHAGTSVDDAAIAGGIVGLNHYAGVLKNAQLKSNLAESVLIPLPIVAASGMTSYAGGLVAYNLGNVYSGVVVTALEQGFATAGTQVGVLVANNAGGDLDSLWTVYAIDDRYALPTMADPLIGTDSATEPVQPNRMVRYGKGDITVDIYGNTDLQPKGGTITFMAADGDVPFYGYTCSPESAEAVPDAAGTGYSPAVAKADGVRGVEGKTYYAVFANSQITDEADWYAFAKEINAGFKVYVSYILKLQGSVALKLNVNHENFAPVGVGQPFVGGLNGNGYSFEMEGGVAQPLFGTIAACSEVTNLTYYVAAGMNYATPVDYEEYSVLGQLAAVNLGRISNVTFESYATVSGDADFAGALVGVNGGRIGALTLRLNTDNVAGADVAGRAYGYHVGSIAGVNLADGVIGTDGAEGIKVVLSSGTVSAGVLGMAASGGAVGVNYGTVRNLSVTSAGVIGTPVVGGTASLGERVDGSDWTLAVSLDGCYAGGVVGINHGRVEGVRYTATGATMSAKSGVGGLVGRNEVGAYIGNLHTTQQVHFAASVTTDAFGGAAGVNLGWVYTTEVVLSANLAAESYAGGLVGMNKGTVQACSLEQKKGYVLYATGTDSYTGGAVGYNEGELIAISADVLGKLGSEDSTYTGGLVGYTTQRVADSYVRLAGDVAGSRKGLAAGASGTANGVNSWAIVSNSVRTGAAGTADSGFNVLKIVGTESVKVLVTATAGGESVLRFEAPAVAGYTLHWYADISRLEGDLGTSTTFTAEVDWQDKLYHVCYYDLVIDTVEEFAAVYTYVNSADLFNGVMFRLKGDLTVPAGGQLQPIGNKQYPFTGIFDGDGHTITFASGSGIAGNDYCGIFGYVAESATIRNLIVDVQEGVTLGSTGLYVGALAGALDGRVENVAINLGSAPYSNKEGARVGALAGRVGAVGNELDNVWVIIYNSACDLLGAPVEGDAVAVADCKANVLDVLGSGKMNILFDTPSLDQGIKRFSLHVVDGFGYYDDLYTDISRRISLSSHADYLNAYGKLVVDVDEGNVYYQPVLSLSGQRYTVSFISLVIRDAADFAAFAHNINQYGDRGARFTFDLGYDEYGAAIKTLVVDLADFPAIGTKAHPFSGILDGTVSLDNTMAYTIVVKGNLTADADYCGLFGYVGEGAVVRNLVIRASDEGQTIGYRGANYTGFLAGSFNGTLENVVVVLNENTKLSNIHADAIGGMMGYLGATARIRNSWLVLPEGSTLGAYGTRADLSVTPPAVMYQCGEGTLSISHQLESYDEENQETVCSLRFALIANDGGAPAYGFIDRTLAEPTRHEQLVAGLADDYTGKEYLALFLKPSIDSAEDLRYLSYMVGVEGRRYLGVEFYLVNDIIIDAGTWTPIGGELETAVGSGEYREVAFIGSFDGNGHTLTFAEGVEASGGYVGLFGLLADSARVRNLHIVYHGSFGGDNTQYAGVLSGVDRGAKLENIIVEYGKNATLRANLETARVAVNKALVYDVDGAVVNYAEVNKAKNVWVLDYNSRYSVEQNRAEQAFYDTKDEVVPQGRFNGGVNVVTIVAAGELNISFVQEAGAISGVKLVNPSAEREVKDWYTLQNGEAVAYPEFVGVSTTYLPSAANQGLVLYASFLQDEIGSLEEFVALAEDANQGYDLYGLTFRLSEDIVIDAASYGSPYFVGVGMLGRPFNATFDGQGHTITLAADMTAVGVYAGIFGYIGEDGSLVNTKLVVRGRLGKTDYADEAQNSRYVGAVGVCEGGLRSVIIDATEAALVTNSQTLGGVALGMDGNNNTNVWVLTNAANSLPLIGEVKGGLESTVNLMREVGMGRILVEFLPYTVDGETTYYVDMRNDTSAGDYAIRGWYSDFSRDNQLSKALRVTALETDVTAGDSGRYLAAFDLIGSRYEVVIMSTVLTTEQELISLSKDVNGGGYTFENTTFTLGADITVSSMEFESIGIANPFMGTFQGGYNGTYYTITMNRHSTRVDTSIVPEAVPLFGINQGVLENVNVVLATDMSRVSSTIGVLAAENQGTIRHCLVVLSADMAGATAGGVAGRNSGEISDCLVYVAHGVTLSGRFSVGGLVGENQGYVRGSTGGSDSELAAWRNASNGLLEAWLEQYRTDRLAGIPEEEIQGVLRELNYTSVMLDGHILAENVDTADDLFAGGAVGYSYGSAVIDGVTVRISTQATVSGKGNSVSVGGLVGRSLAALQNTVVLADGRVLGEGVRQTFVGYYGGDVQSMATNSWLSVPVPPSVKIVGNGTKVNLLQVGGNGHIDTYIDRQDNIIFSNVTPASGAAIDGWYVGSGVEVPEDVGNATSESFRPNTGIISQTVNVVFINTQIRTVADLLAMAETVNSGLFAPHLSFMLMNNLVIDSEHPFAATIGTKGGEKDSGFKHEFDGQGFTITVVPDQEGNLPLVNSVYMGLFGYTTADAVIKNLTLTIVGGDLGGEMTQVIGGLVGENNGLIENCHVNIGERGGAEVRLIGAIVGGMVGFNRDTGRIENSSLCNYGVMRGVGRSASNMYVGGVVGRNAGDIVGIEVLHAPVSSDSIYTTYMDGYTGSSYVGGVSGNNSGHISNVRVELARASFNSVGAITSYVGGVVGSNTSILQNVYVLVDESTTGTILTASSGNVGGVVGSNNHYMGNILIHLNHAITNDDSAVGFVGNNSLMENVWVYNTDATLNSTASAANNMTYRMDGVDLVALSDPARIVTEGYIQFDLTIDKERGLSVYAQAHDDFKSVLVEDYVRYEDGKLRLVTSAESQGIWVRGEIRRTVGHESELKAMAKALRLGGQEIVGTFTQVDDILIAGDFDAIGTEERPFAATLQGGFYTIEFATDRVHFGEGRALFGVLSGRLEQVVVMHQHQAEMEQGVYPAGVAQKNNGTLSEVVVYMMDGVSLSTPIATLGENAKANSNVWIISRTSMAGNPSGLNAYSVIIVHGAGRVEVAKEEPVLAFRAVTAEAEGIAFADWSDTKTVLNLSGEVFSTVADYAESNATFTAEFLSTNLANTEDLEVLLALIEMEYKGLNDAGRVETFTLTADMSIDADRLQTIAAFKGNLLGGFHTLKVVGGEEAATSPTVKRAALGSLQANVAEIVFDLTELSEGYFLLDASSTGQLTRVVVVEEGTDGRLMDNYGELNYGVEDVYVLTHNQTLYDNRANALSAGTGVILIEGEGEIDFARVGAEALYATAVSSESAYFSGWYQPVGNELQLPEHTKTDARHLLTGGSNVMVVRFIQADLDSAEDVERLLEGTLYGFTYEGGIFQLNEDLSLPEGLCGGLFDGHIEGNGHTLSLQSPLFEGLRGGLSHTYITVPTVAVKTLYGTATLESVVVTTEMENATLANAGTGVLSHVWLVAPTLAQSVGGLNVLLKDATATVEASILEDGQVQLTLLPTDGGFVLLHKEGEVYCNPDYNVIASTAEGGIYTARATDEIRTSAELEAYAVALAHGYAGATVLAEDITLPLGFRPLSGAVNLSGEGHTLTVAHSAQTLLGASDLAEISNVIVKLQAQVENFVLAEEDDVRFVHTVIYSVAEQVNWHMGATYEQVWWLHQADLTDSLAYTLPEGVHVLRYAKGNVASELTESENWVRFVADPTAGQYFLGYHTEEVEGLRVSEGVLSASALAEDVRVQAMFADKNMSTVAQWNHLAKALAVGNFSGAGLTFHLAADIALGADDLVLGAFGGRLEGNFYSISLADMSLPAGGPIQLTASGSVSNLALEVAHDVTLAAGGWLTEGEVNNTWIVSEQPFAVDGEPLAHGARLMVVDNTLGRDAYIQVNSTGARFTFVAHDLDEYRLHRYTAHTESGDVDYLVDEGGYEVLFDATCTDDVTATFLPCYTVYVDIEGIAEELVVGSLTTTTYYWWTDEAEGAKVEFTSHVPGYLFKGFSYTSSAVTEESFDRLLVDIKALDESIHIKAEYLQITSTWQSITYGDMTGEELNGYLTLPEEIMSEIAGAEYTCERLFLADSDVSFDEEDAYPYHAGGYEVKFTILREGKIVGLSEGLGFRIEPRMLYFEDIRLTERKYNSSPDAIIKSLTFGGFAPQDEAYADQLSWANVGLQYYDPIAGVPTANAGTWTLIVKEGSYLDSATLNSDCLFSVDYVLPQGILYRYSNGNATDEPYVGTINKQVLNLIVSDFSVDYLAQFGQLGDNGWVSFNVNEYLNNYVPEEGVVLTEADKQAIRAAQLLYIEGDSIWTDAEGILRYAYQIKPVGTYRIYPNAQALANFEPRISQEQAMMSVVATPISVRVVGMDLVYGDKLGAIRYELWHEGSLFSLSEADYAEMEGYLNLGTYADVLADLAVYLTPVAALAEGGAVAFADVAPGTYGLRYAFDSANRNFCLADTSGATPEIDESGLRRYVFEEVNPVLTVSGRPVTYRVTSALGKTFASAETPIEGVAVNSWLASGDRLVLVREAGEWVGEYAVSAKVMRGNSDVSHCYLLTSDRAEGYTYPITARVVTIKRTGTGIFAYGSSEMQSMPYALVMNQEVAERIRTITGKSVADLFQIKLGYFGEDVQSVGTYYELAFEVSYAKGVNQQALSAAVQFVVDRTTQNYTIVPAVLTVRPQDFTRDYDTSDLLSGLSASVLNVSGWVGKDANKFTKVVEEWTSPDIRAGVGQYTYRPVELKLIAKKNADADILDNYTLEYQWGSYTIRAISLDVEAAGGYYDETGTFSEFEGSSVNFGDPRAAWYFYVDESTLPEYIQERLAEMMPESDLARTQALMQLLSIQARSISSLAIGTMVGEEEGYLPHSADSNLDLEFSVYFEILPIRVVVTNVRLFAADSKSRPTIGFTVQAYDDNGMAIEGYTLTVERAEADTYIQINEAFALRFTVESFVEGECVYRLAPYVQDNGRWYAYVEDESHVLLLTPAEGESAEDATLPMTGGVQNVIYDDSFSDRLAMALEENLGIVVGATVGGAVLIAVGAILGVVLARRRRMTKSVARELRHERIVESLKRAPAEKESSEESSETEGE